MAGSISKPFALWATWKARAMNPELGGSGWQKGEGRLFSAVPSDRAKGARHKLEHRKLHLNMKRNFFTLRVVEPWSSCPEK